jgi:protein-disulfide isomerase
MGPTREDEAARHSSHRRTEALGGVWRKASLALNTNRTTAPSVPVPRGATSSGDGIVVGTGPVDVAAYIDFQCPFCKHFELNAAPIMDKLLEDRIISFVRHPMNFLDAASTTAYSSRAAAASAAASDAGMFHEYTRTLFEHQPPEGGPGLTDGQPVELGQEIGITNPEFAETIRRGTYLPWPSFVTERSIARGIAGTPSVFVRDIPVASRPGLILAVVNRVLT